MKHIDTPCNEPRGDAWVSGAKTGPNTRTSTIEYEGAKVARVPLSFVLVGIVLAVAAAFAARHFLGS